MADREVTVGRVRGVFGVKGEIRVESYMDRPEAILDFPAWELVKPGGARERVTVRGGRPLTKGLAVQVSGSGPVSRGSPTRWTRPPGSRLAWMRTIPSPSPNAARPSSVMPSRMVAAGSSPMRSARASRRMRATWRSSQRTCRPVQRPVV